MEEKNRSNTVKNSAGFSQSLDLNQILSVLLGMKWYIIIAVVVCLGAAYAYTRIVRTQYTSNAKIMLVNKDNTSLGSESAVLSDITGFSINSKVQNEVEILSSHNLMQEVVEDLGLNFTYIKSRRVKSIILYGCNPVEMVYNGSPNFPNPVNGSIVFTPVDSVQYIINSIVIDGEERVVSDLKFKFGATVALLNDTFVFNLIRPEYVEYGEKYEVHMTSSFARATSFLANLQVTIGKVTDRSDVIQLSFTDVLPQRCEAILDALINRYNTDAKLFSNKARTNTITFLEGRLAELEGDIGAIEGAYRDYSRENTLVDVQSQSQLTLVADERTETQLDDLNTQIDLLAIVKECISQMGNKRDILPANIGISDAGLNSTINLYNGSVIDRNRLVSSSSEQNPIVISADAQIDALLSSIRESVNNLDRSYKVQQANLSAKIREGKKKISNIPTQQLTLSNFARQQEIKEPLYILLQQKLEEARISLYSVTDQCKVIDYAAGTALPTYPNKKIIFLLAFLIGFCVPPASFFIREYFKTTVSGKLDVSQRTELPVLASIPSSKSPDTLIKPDGRDPFEESVRILRSSMKYLNHKVFQVTSSLPGEGKTFIAANLAVSLSHIGKRVLLVGVDLRKPRLAQLFGIEPDRHKGVVPFLAGRIDEICSSIISNCIGINNLDVLLAGPVPPNPSELLESDRMELLMNMLRSMEEYDYIILDGSPYMPVADTITVNNYVDANLFVIRAGVCALKFVQELDSLAEKGKLKNVSIVLNDIDITSKSYGYYYDYGYGYYGYGHRYGYGHKYGYGYGYGYGTPSESSSENES